MFYPFDRPLAKEAIPVLPETGMLLLHKHGDDCLLVSSLHSSPRWTSPVWDEDDD